MVSVLKVTDDDKHPSIGNKKEERAVGVYLCQDQ